MGFWVITLVIVKRERVASSAREHVISHLNVRGMKSCATIVVKHVVSVPSVPSQSKRRGRWSSRIISFEVCVFINSTHLIEIVDTSATYSFISLSCVERLSLVLTLLLRGMFIDTPTDGSVATSLVCAKCPVNFGHVEFELDLVCLPLVNMDVIFGKDWMSSFSVDINFLTKSITFSKPVDGKFLTAEQVKKFLDGEASVFMMFVSLKVSVENGVGDFIGIKNRNKILEGLKRRFGIFIEIKNIFNTIFY